jgi:FtsZ-binding cell division protein ZapB
MSDLIKTILAVLITSVLSAVGTTQVLTVEIASLKDTVNKNDTRINQKVDKLSDRLLDTQLKQAQYLAAN